MAKEKERRRVQAEKIQADNKTANNKQAPHQKEADRSFSIVGIGASAGVNSQFAIRCGSVVQFAIRIPQSAIKWSSTWLP